MRFCLYHARNTSPDACDQTGISSGSDRLHEATRLWLIHRGDRPHFLSMEEEIFEWPWPTGPAADHILARQRALALELAGRIPIFLDTNFWVMARQAATGESDDPELIRLLGAMRLAVGSQKVFFPVTSDLIAEFSKQTSERLEDTMQMVDRLSLGIAMLPHSERLALDVEAFTAKVYPKAIPIERPLWTSFAFSYGYRDLRPPDIDVEIDDDMLVGLAEKAWMAPPSLLGSTMTSEMFEAQAESERLAAYLNEQHTLHAGDIDSHATAVRIETAGGASMIVGIAAREYRRLAASAGETFEAADVPNSHRVGLHIAAMVAKGLEQKVNQRAFGSLYVPAMLHAAVRSHGKRKLRPNDIFDFRHAAAALPYCRVFLTDRPLRSLIASGHVALKTLYNCEVVSTPAEAIEILGRMTLGSAGQGAPA